MALPEDATIADVEDYLTAGTLDTDDAAGVLYFLKMCGWALHNSVGPVENSTDAHSRTGQHTETGDHRVQIGTLGNRPAHDTDNAGKLYFVHYDQGTADARYELHVDSGHATDQYAVFAQALASQQVYENTDHSSLAKADEALDLLLGLIYDEDLDPESELVKSESVYYMEAGSANDPPTDLTEGTLRQYLRDIISFLWGDGGADPGIRASDIFYVTPAPANSDVHTELDTLYTWKADVTENDDSAKGCKLIGCHFTGTNYIDDADGIDDVYQALEELDNQLGNVNPGLSASVSHTPSAGSFLENEGATNASTSLEAINDALTQWRLKAIFQHYDPDTLPDTNDGWVDQVIWFPCPVDPTALTPAAVYVNNLVVRTADAMTGDEAGGGPYIEVGLWNTTVVGTPDVYCTIDNTATAMKWASSIGDGNDTPIALTSFSNYVNVGYKSDGIVAEAGLYLSFTMYWYEMTETV